jgi:hypothetical protein
MTRKAAGAVVLVAGLACSACGSGSSRATTTTSVPRTVTVQMPVTRSVVRASGTGSKALGIFYVHRGTLSVSFSCTGKGNFNVAPSPAFVGIGTVCPQADLGGSRGPVGGGRGQIKVNASPRVHWTLAMREIYAKPSTVPAGLQQLPVRRSGVGPESLGTFAMPRGWLYIEATCVGTGTFGVWWNKNGGDLACRNSRHKPTVKISSNFSVHEHRARIDVHAPVGMKWTVLVFEGPPDFGPGYVNVW